MPTSSPSPDRWAETLTKRFLSAELDVRKATRRYESGQSLAEIAADLGVGVKHVEATLEAHGVTMRPREPRRT